MLPQYQKYAGDWFDPSDSATPISVVINGGNIRATSQTGWSPATGTFNGNKIAMFFSGTQLTGTPNITGDRIEWDNGCAWVKASPTGSRGISDPTPTFAPPRLPPGLRWEKIHGSHLPTCAIIAGEEAGGRVLFVARAWFNGWQVGKSYGTDYCLIPCEQQEIRIDHDFEILTAPQLPPDQCLRWRSHTVGLQYPGLIQMGLDYDQRSKIFLGRLPNKKRGSHCIGPVLAASSTRGTLSYGQDNQVNSTTMYDILVLTTTNDAKGTEVAIDGVTKGTVELTNNEGCKLVLVNDCICPGSIIAGYLQFRAPKKMDITEVTLQLAGEEVVFVTTFCTDQNGYQRKKQATKISGLEGCKLQLGPRGQLEFGTHFFPFIIRVPHGVPLTQNNSSLTYILTAHLSKGYSGGIKAQRKIVMYSTYCHPNPPQQKPWAPMWMLSDEQFEQQEKQYLEERMKKRAKTKQALLDKQQVEYDAVRPAVTEEIFQNERWVVLIGWSSKGLLPTDRPHWCDANQKGKKKDEVKLPAADWRWQEGDEWHIDKTGSDDNDGWWYACNWPKTGFIAASKEWSPKKQSTSFVRRRKWVRTRVNPGLTPAFEQAKARHVSELQSLEASLSAEQNQDQATSQQRWQTHVADSAHVKTFLEAFIQAGHHWENSGHADFPQTLQSVSVPTSGDIHRDGGLSPTPGYPPVAGSSVGYPPGSPIMGSPPPPLHPGWSPPPPAPPGAPLPSAPPAPPTSPPFGSPPTNPYYSH